MGNYPRVVSRLQHITSSLYAKKQVEKLLLSVSTELQGCFCSAAYPTNLDESPLSSSPT